MRALCWHGKGDARRDTVRDPSYVITHRVSLIGPRLYETFRDKKDGCFKIVMRP